MCQGRSTGTAVVNVLGRCYLDCRIAQDGLVAVYYSSAKQAPGHLGGHHALSDGGCSSCPLDSVAGLDVTM